MIKRLSIILCLLCFVGLTYGQRRAVMTKPRQTPDSVTAMVWTCANFSYQWPIGDLGTFYKGNFSIGTGFTYKTATHWTFDVHFNYCFGANLRDTTLLDNLKTSKGDIIDGNGLKATLYLEGQYWHVGAGLGRIIPVSKTYLNSGIWIHAGLGYIRHKIHFTDVDNQVPQIGGDYRKGYDRRSSGFFLSQFIGYVHIGKSRVASFYGGVEIMEMWTKPDRNYDFNLGPTKDLKNKFSGLIGLKIGWIVPLYTQKHQMTYYYN
ncbi:MAG: hypothetical protein IJU33_03810 [Bacteroidales bacterium]|nr:hypothetical protein [Bacteroidales bacterium]